MADSDWTLREVIKRFQLQLDDQSELFAPLLPVEPSAWLRSILDETAALALAIHTEKARSELIVAPILVEVRRRAKQTVSLFSGVDFSVDPANGLSGVCDFIISQSPEQLFVNAPVLAIVEAKNDNIKSGLGQCIAEMIAAQIFNAREGTMIETVYGVVTTGSIWKFLRLQQTQVSIDRPEYYLDDLATILAMLFMMVQGVAPDA